MASEVVVFDGKKAIPFTPHMTLSEFLSESHAAGGVLSPSEAYEVSAFFRAAVEMRAGAVAGLPVEIVDRTGRAVWASDTGEPPPAGFEVFADIARVLADAERDLCLFGAAYFLRDTDDDGTPFLRRLHPATMRPEFDDVGALVGFQRILPGRAMPVALSVEDVVHVFLPPVATEVGTGPAPARAALQAAAIEHAMQTFAALYFRRGATKTTILSVPATTPQAEAQRLKTWWQKLTSGVQKAFGLVVLSDQVKPTVIGEGMDDLTEETLAQFVREEIARAFGIPFSLLVSNAANYATARVDRLAFYTETVIPEARHIIAHLEAVLAPPFRLRIAEERVPALADGVLVQAESVTTLVASGILSVREAREMLGWETQAETPDTDTTAPAMSEDMKRLWVAASLEELRAYRRARAKRREAWAWEWTLPEVVRMVAPYADVPDFAHVLDHVREAMKATPEDLSAEEARMAEVVMQVFERHRARALAALREGRTPDVAALRRDLRAALQGVFFEIASDEAERLAQSLALSSDDELLAELAGWAARYADERAAQMAESTLNIIRRALEASDEAGRVDWTAITARLFGDVRANVVGITEATQALSVAAQIHAQRLAAQGVEGVEVRWLTAEDERVCPICRPLDHLPRSKWQEKMPSGPPAHPRCRCRLVVEARL